MRKLGLLLLTAAPLILGACDKVSDGSAPNQAVATAEDAAASAGPQATGKRQVAALTLPLLAYSHSYRFELPGSEARSLMSRHEATCIAAGPASCQVMEAQAKDEDGDFTGTLRLRGDPVWLNRFRAGLESDAGSVGGKLQSVDTETEDLSTQVVDTDAAIAAKIVLRDRLKEMVARREGKLADVLQVEQRLAEVQGEIDAARSHLSVMRGRTQTSSLTIGYASFDRLVTSRAMQPLKSAAGSVAGIVATGLALILLLGACLLPIALVAAPGLLILRHRARKPAGTAS